MKLANVLSRVATVGFAAFVAAVLLNAAATLTFVIATGAFLALIAAHDYSPVPRPRVAVAATVLRFTAQPAATEDHRLAA